MTHALPCNTAQTSMLVIFFVAHKLYELHGIFGAMHVGYDDHDVHDVYISLTLLDAVMTSCVCICFFFLGSVQLGFPGQLGFHLFFQVARARGILWILAVLSSVRVDGRQEYYGCLYSLLATSRDSFASA